MKDEFIIQERTYSCFWYSNFDVETKKEIISKTVEQVIDKFKEHWNFKYYIKDNDYTRLVNHLQKNFTFSRIIETFNEFDVGDLFLSNIEYDIIQFTNQLTEDDISNILKIDEEIKRQIQRYGYHEELVETGKSSIIMWSDGCVCWNIAYLTKIKKGNTIRLDASMVIIPYPKNIIKKYLCLLDENPLYKYSFEAVYERGETPFIAGIIGYASKMMESAEYKKMQEKYA